MVSAGTSAVAVQYTASWSGVKEASAPEQDSAVCEVEQTSTNDEGEDACPVWVGDATIHQDGEACWDGPELIIPHKLEFEELILPACETDAGLAAEESPASPALLELEEGLA